MSDEKSEEQAMPTTAAIVELFKDKRRLFELFAQSVSSSFLSEPALNTGTPAIIHSTRSRTKDERHLFEKIERKKADGREYCIFMRSNFRRSLNLLKIK